MCNVTLKLEGGGGVLYVKENTVLIGKLLQMLQSGPFFSSQLADICFSKFLNSNYNIG